MNSPASRKLFFLHYAMSNPHTKTFCLFCNEIVYFEKFHIRFSDNCKLNFTCPFVKVIYHLLLAKQALLSDILALKIELQA